MAFRAVSDFALTEKVTDGHSYKGITCSSIALAVSNVGHDTCDCLSSPLPMIFFDARSCHNTHKALGIDPQPSCIQLCRTEKHDISLH